MTKEEKKKILGLVLSGLEIFSIFMLVLIWEAWNEEYKAVSLILLGLSLLSFLYISCIVVCIFKREEKEQLMKEAQQTKKEEQKVL